MSTLTDILGNGTPQPSSTNTSVTEGQNAKPAVTQQVKDQKNLLMQQVHTDAQNAISKAQTPLTYQQMYQQLNPFHVKTPQEEEAERRRHNRRAVLTSVADGIRAIANMHAATNGAQSTLDGRNTISARMRAIYDRDRADYETKRNNYITGLLNARKMDDAQQLSQQKQDEATAYKDKLLELNKQKQDEATIYREKYIELLKEKAEEQKRSNREKEQINKERVSVSRTNAKTAQTRAANSASSNKDYTETQTTEYETDQYGNLHRKTSTKKRESNDGKGKGYGGKGSGY